MTFSQALFFAFFSSNKKFRILNTTRTFLDFIQNQQKKTQKNLTQQTKTGGKKMNNKVLGFKAGILGYSISEMKAHKK